MSFRIDWQKLEPNIVQVDKTVSNKRLSKFAISCSYCQHESLVTYCAIHLIIKTDRKYRCKSCTAKQVGNKPPTTKKGFTRKIKNSHNRGTTYRNLFTPVSEETKLKQRTAKLGLVGEDSNNW